METLSKNRLVFLVGLMTAGLALFIYALMIHPKKSRASATLSREAMELEQAVALLQREPDDLRKALGRVAEKGLPVYPRSDGGFREEAARIIAGMDRLVRSSNVQLLRLEPQPREQRGSLAMHPFLVEVKGGFHQISAFLKGVESELLLVPSLFTMEAGAKEAGGIRASFRLNAHEWMGQKLVLGPKRQIEVALLPNPVTRDPFAPPGPGAGLEIPRARGPVLSGILMVGGKAKAIIDGKTYSQGDMVAGRRILSITQEEVVLEGEPRPLRIDRPLKKVGPS